MREIALWLEAGAEAMATARPDLWTVRTAHEQLLRWKHELDIKDWPFISSGGFTLYRNVSSGETEYNLTAQVVDLVSYDDNSDPFVYVWDCTGGASISECIIDKINDLYDSSEGSQ